MEKLLLTTLSLLAINYSFGQFNTSGTVTSTSNSVGIGTPNPLSSFDVTGANTTSAMTDLVKINAAFLHDHVDYSGGVFGF